MIKDKGMWTVLRVFTLALCIAAVARAETAGEKCAIAKLKAAAKKASAKVACHTKAIKNGDLVDSDCLMTAEEKFNAAFAKAQDKGGCLFSGDTSIVEGYVDDFVSQVVAAEPGCFLSGSFCDFGAPESGCCAGLSCGPSGVFFVCM